MQAAGAAAHLALENARLQAELRAQLAQVEESRARIVAAGDEQRRRIERDLHDGAQQRLVAHRARAARRAAAHGQRPRPGRRATARRSTVDELQVAVEELRELAHGIHPAILAEGGLAAALDTLAARSPLPVDRRVDAPRAAAAPESRPTRTSSPARRSRTSPSTRTPTRATVAARCENGTLAIEVADDGARRRDARRRHRACAGSPTGSRRAAGGSASRARPAAARASWRRSRARRDRRGLGAAPRGAREAARGRGLRGRRPAPATRTSCC